MKVFIYALCDSTGSIRYIGKTVSLQVRLKDHIRRCRESNTRKNAWIRSILKKGESPSIIIIEEVTQENWQERERFWISEMKANGAILTNGDDGGMGGMNRFVSPETREKLRLSSSKYRHSEESKRKISASNKRRVITEETRAKLSRVLSGKKMPEGFGENQREKMLGRTHTQASKDKVSAARIGKPRPLSVGMAVAKANSERVVSAETRAKISALSKGRKLSPQAIENMKAAQRKRREAEQKGQPPCQSQ